MDFIRPIGPIERDVDPVLRVERAPGEHEQREADKRKRRPRPQPPASAAGEAPEGPVEGDDGHLHVDIRA
jgi:hypothetical protein